MRYYHSLDPDEEWKDRLHFLLRLPSIVGSGVIEGLATGGISWFFDQDLEIWLAGASAILITIGTLLNLRWAAKRELEDGIALHNLCDCIRDEVAEVLLVIREALSEGYAADDRAIRRALIANNNAICDRVASYFRSLTRDSSVAAAIRLTGNDAGKTVYITVGRSSNMHPRRKEQSIPIPADEGVPGRIKKENFIGAAIVDDIKKDIDEKHWVESPTDDYADVKYLMVVPINGYEVGGDEVSHKKVNFGLLHITSAKRRFGARYTEAAKAIADILGIVFPFIHGEYADGANGASGANGK